MDALAFLLVLALLAAGAGAALLGLVAYVRTRRLDELARRLAVLERRLRELQGAQAAPRRAPQALAAPRSRSALPGTPQRERPAPPAAAPPRRHAPPAPVGRVDWERRIGIRGAAVVGGILLALAGVLLVQHSIERGWITPGLRVAIAAVGGVAALLVSVPLHRRGYAQTADALAGAGAVMLYGALWAGRSLYGLFGSGLALPGMVAVTAASGRLALRRPSRVVAVFALAGGFATPLLLSLGSERPLFLFGYLLLFDLGVVAAARRPRSGWLGVLASLGTLLVGGPFLLVEPRPGGLVALAFLGLSACVLSIPALSHGGSRDGPTSAAGAAVMLLGAFPLAIHVSSLADFGQPLWPMTLLAAALQLLAGAVARRARAPWLSVCAAVGATALALAHVLSAPGASTPVPSLLAALFLLAALPHGLLEWRARASAPGPDVAAPLAAAAGMTLVLALAPAVGSPGAALVAALAFSALLLRQAFLAGRGELAFAAAGVPAALWFLSWLRGSAPQSADTSHASLALASVAPVALFALHAFLAREGALARASRGALVLAATLMMLALAPRGVPAGAGAAALGVQGAALALLLLASAGAAGPRASLALVFPVLAAARTQALASVALDPGSAAASASILLQLASALAVALSPAWTPRAREPSDRWVAAALAPWIWLPGLLELFPRDAASWRAVAALSLAACAAASWTAARRSRALEAPRAVGTRRAALAAGSVSTHGLVAVALTLGLERGLWTVAPALTALAAARTFRSTPHRILPWLAAGLLAWSTLRLGLELGELARGAGDWPRSGLPVLHWGTYGWGLSAVAGLVASWQLAGRGPALAARICGGAGLLLLFGWVNLEVQNLFQEGPMLELVLRREPVRDAATSISWGLFAMALLVTALRTRGAGLRWASLGFFLAALLRVFLVDLGELRGLHRVASIAALSLTLLSVSLLYQRFVLRAPAGDSAQG